MTSTPVTWEEAFRSQSIVSIKALEKELRTSSARDKERLRNLVGSNYRELLSTADQIVQLDQTVREVETRIAKLSSSCSPPETQNGTRKIRQSTLVIVHLKTVAKLLSRVDDPLNRSGVLLTAQRIVIARLVLRSVEESVQQTKVYQTLTARLKQRQSLGVAQINHVLSHSEVYLPKLANALCAYCLVFACSPSDGIQHIHELRLARLTAQDERGPISKSGLLSKCYYLVQSTTAIRRLHGRVTTDILNSLQKKATLQNIVADSPDLGILCCLLPTDIQSFTPYIPKPSPAAHGVDEAVAVWTDDATRVLLEHLASYVSLQKLEGVLATRRDVLGLLLESCFSASTCNHVIPEVENIFSSRIVELISASCWQITKLGTDPVARAHGTRSEILWETQWLHKKGIEQGATVHQCQARYLGMHKDLERHLQRINVWSKRCFRHQVLLRELGDIRWQDKIEDHDDEDEEAAESIVQQLTRDSPEHFMATYDETLQEVVSKFVQQVSETCRVLGHAEEFSRLTSWMRFLREVYSLLQRTLPSPELDKLRTEVERLQNILVEKVLQEWRERLARLDTAKADPFVPDGLPTSRAVNAIWRLCVLMAERGGHDIWTRSAVDALKVAAQSHVLRGEGDELCIGSKFDELYFRAALATSSAPCEATDQETATIQKRATAYWARTRSLFGVLDP